MASGFINAIVAAQDNIEKLYKTQGGLNSELFLHSAKIFDIDDPENLSRVRVLFEENDENAKSDWIPVLNSGAGKISSQYLDSVALVASISGDPDNCIVIGLYSKSTKGNALSAAPIVVPVLDKADTAYTTDPGSKCSKENEGKMYLFSNNVSQDVKICVRRNNRQNDPSEDVWEWKNITRGLVIEKSEDPKQLPNSEVVVKQKPLPNCAQELEGEIISYSEDRDLRQVPLICRKDENKEWAWVPVSSPPTYFKTTLPKCTEKVHGQTALIDDGNNSELGICVRWDGDMKWVKYGTRQVIKFATDKPSPISKSEMLSSVRPNPNLSTIPAQFASSVTQSPVLGSSALAAALLSQAGLIAVGAEAGNTSANSILSGLGGKILSEQGISGDAFASVLNSGDIATAENLISSLGPGAEAALRNGTIDPSQLLQIAGGDGLINSIQGLSDVDAGVYLSGLVGGGQGLLDSAVQYGLDKIPGVSGDLFNSAISGLDLGNAPGLLSSVLSGASGGGLTDIVTSAASGINFGGIDVGALGGQLLGGDLGNVAQVFQNFSNLGSLTSLVPGLPLSASSLLGAAGLGGPLSFAFPGAGLGLSVATSLLGGTNPLTSILGGGGALGSLGSIGGLFGGLFGGGGGPSCPCDVVCRKTKHGVDSDGNRILDPAGTLTTKNSNVYGSNILNNNNTCLAGSRGFFNSGIGKELVPSNPFDFTNVIKSIPRVGQLSTMLEQAMLGGAEQDDLNLEMLYSMEAIEKTFKMADNNMSLMELIQRLNLLGSSDFMNNLIADKSGGLLGKMSQDDIEMSTAIKDLYLMVKQLNSVKKGGSANVAPTPAITATIANIGLIPSYFAKSKARSLLNLIKNILEGLSILGTLDPELKAPFEDLETRNTESKVLNDSLSSKLASDQPKEDTANQIFSSPYINNGLGDLQGTSSTGDVLNNISQNILSSNQLESGDFDTLLSQIQNEQERARRGEGDCS